MKTYWIGCFCLLLLSGCGSSEWKEFTSSEGRFKIQFPGTPKETKTATPQGELKSFQLTNAGSIFAVEWIDLAPKAGEDEAAIDQRLRTLRIECLTELNAQLIKDRPIKLDDKYPGREFTADVPAKANLMQARFFLVDGRLYRVITLIAKSGEETPEVSKFLDSFRVETKPGN